MGCCSCCGMTRSSSPTEMPGYSLVAASVLEEVHGELSRRIQDLDAGYVITSNAEGEALARALLFERWPELITTHALNPIQALYNRYFWYARYVALRQQERGKDDGLEQQLFHISRRPASNSISIS